MVWLSPRSVQFGERGNTRKAYRQSIELPIAISVGGLPAPVYGTLVNISESGCRLRSLILIERDRDVEFELKRPNGEALSLRGRIISRATPPTGGGFEYGVNFAPMSPDERGRLAIEIHEMQRREGAERAQKRDSDAPRPAAASKQRRNSVRTLVSFPIRYRAPHKVASNASATDVSMGGLRLMTLETIALGTVLELRFTLPPDYLYVYPPAAERTEISPFGPRTVRVPDNRRPFNEMSLHGRVVSRFQVSRGREVYGVQFTDIDGYHREEIARFTHAVQLAKLRSE